MKNKKSNKNQEKKERKKKNNENETKYKLKSNRIIQVKKHNIQIMELFKKKNKT